MVVPAKQDSPRQPDRAAYLRQSATLIDDLLAHPLPMEIIRHSFEMATPMFFVDSDKFRYALKGGVTLIQAQASELLTWPSRPSRKELDKLRIGDALSLFAIVRMHEAFIELCRRGAACASTIEGAGLRNGLEAASVMPAILRVNRSRFKSLLDELKIPNSAVAACLRQHGYAGQYAPEEMIRELADGYSGQGNVRTGAYRVTDKTAWIVSGAVSAASAGKTTQQAVFDRIFDPSPQRGPGNGTMTQALPLVFGNDVSRPVRQEAGGVRAAPSTPVTTASSELAPMLSVEANADAISTSPLVDGVEAPAPISASRSEALNDASETMAEDAPPDGSTT